jgi:transposase
LHLVTDARGVPLAATITPGQAHESKSFEETMNAVKIPVPGGGLRRRPRRLAGDKGYSYERIRAWLRRHRIEAVIPRRSNQPAGRKPLDKAAYRRRNAVERCVGWLKEARRIGTRFEKLGEMFLAMIHMAIIERYFRTLFRNRA